MTHIRNTLHELLKEELTSEILSNLSVPEDELIRLKVHLTQQPVQLTGCCISITQGKYGLVVSNIGGPIEEVLGRRVCVEIDNAGDLSDAEVLGLVLQALFISGYSAHLHSDNEVVETTGEGIPLHQYIEYPCLWQLVCRNGLYIITEIAREEGSLHRLRLPGYMDFFNIIRLADVNLLEPNSRPIFIEEEEGNLYIYGIADEDDIKSIILRPIKVFTTNGEPLSEGRVIVGIIKHYTVDGVALDLRDPRERAYGNDFGMIARGIKYDIQNYFKATGSSSPDAAYDELHLYESLSHAYEVLTKGMRTGYRRQYMSILDRAIGVRSYRIEAPMDIPPERRVDCFENSLKYMAIREYIPQVNAIIMMISTPPSTPLTDGKEKLQKLYERYIQHDGIRETLFLHGHQWDLSSEQRTVLYIFAFTTTAPSETEPEKEVVC